MKVQDKKRELKVDSKVSNASKKKWSDEETTLFFEGILKHGKCSKKVVEHMGGSKTAHQVAARFTQIVKTFDPKNANQTSRNIYELLSKGTKL